MSEFCRANVARVEAFSSTRVRSECTAGCPATALPPCPSSEVQSAGMRAA
eukprot:CAMPEP_0113293240 /NCGR_PEP_ID=MMETSP0008_2-20120614/35214_1 /TAXON_ID=97485 /ORGANISM="Prymnesium parvum" /LENGTH=49 /DNA_ID=CAMNT_0000145681 /DNA_START=30 /DNA_END=175 /DNA_ORIENTATION=- /assembly_acc=CAM_ASM_000153